MDAGKKVEQGACSPGLSPARVVAVSTVFLRQLGQSSPAILLNLVPGFEQQSMQIVQRIIPLSLVKLQICSQEISQWPPPLRSLILSSVFCKACPIITYIVVVPSLCDCKITRIVRVLICGTVLEIFRVQSLHTKRTTQHLIRKLQCSECMLLIENLRGERHRDGKVASELIVRPFMSCARSVHILINPSTIDQLGVDIVFRVIFCILAKVSVMCLLLSYSVYSPTGT